jgi:hypothetical protein
VFWGICDATCLSIQKPSPKKFENKLSPAGDSRAHFFVAKAVVVVVVAVIRFFWENRPNPAMWLLALKYRALAFFLFL